MSSFIKALIGIYIPKKDNDIDDEADFYKELLQKMTDADTINEILVRNNVKSVGIISKGYAGKKILKTFLNTSCDVLFYDDPTANKKEIHGVPVMNFKKTVLPDVDLVIICNNHVPWFKYSLVNFVSERTRIASLEDVLNDEISPRKEPFDGCGKYFMGAGFAKCATTTMDAILRQHPEIEMACHKEPVFFAEVELAQRGFDWYERRYYPKKDSGKIRGEFNPWNQGHAKNIQEFIGKETKFLYIVRNPVDAVISRFKHFYINGQYDIDNDHGKLNSELFETFINKRKNDEQARVLLADYEYGRVFTNLLKYTDKDKVMLIDFKEFIKDRENTAKKVFEFLGVNPNVKINYDIEANIGTRLPKSKQAMKKAARQFRFWWEVYVPFFPYLGKFERTMDKWRWGISDRASIKCDAKLDVSEETRQFLKDYFREDVKVFDDLFGTNYYEKWKFN